MPDNVLKIEIVDDGKPPVQPPVVPTVPQQAGIPATTPPAVPAPPVAQTGSAQQPPVAVPQLAPVATSPQPQLPDLSGLLDAARTPGQATPVTANRPAMAPVGPPAQPPTPQTARPIPAASPPPAGAAATARVGSPAVAQVATGAGAGAGAARAAGAATGAGAGAAAGGAGAAAGTAAGAGAAAGGPAAVALIAAEVTSQKMADGMKTAQAAMADFGSVTRKVAGNDTMGLFTGAVEKSATTLEKIPVAGKVLGEALKAAAAPVVEFAAVTEAFVARGRELQAYNADLAAANAQADVKRLLADIDEAEKLGENLGRLTEAQAQMGTDFREILMPIKELLSEMLAGIAENLSDVVSAVKDVMVPILQGLADFIRAITKEVGDVYNAILKPLIERIMRLLRIQERREEAMIGHELNSMMKEVLGLGNTPPPVSGVPDPNNVQSGERLAVPILG